MPELSSDVRSRPQPVEGSSAVAPVPQATLARRRRLIRWGGLATFVLGMGLSAIPGPKGSSHTVTTEVENGVTSQVHHFFFSRHFGLPFETARLDYNDDGSLKDLSVEGGGFLENLGAALVIVICTSMFLRRKRREE